MRIRQIKPEFWKHEGLGDISRDARLLFIGLWAMADCAGRLDDRPKRIKAELFPYDDISINMIDILLDELANHSEKFITRYTANGENYLQINRFNEHQRLMGNESKAESKRPAPPVTDDNNEYPKVITNHYQPLPSNHHTEIRSNGNTEIRSNGNTDIGVTEENDNSNELSGTRTVTAQQAIKEHGFTLDEVAGGFRAMAEAVSSFDEAAASSGEFHNSFNETEATATGSNENNSPEPETPKPGKTARKKPGKSKSYSDQVKFIGQYFKGLLAKQGVTTFPNDWYITSYAVIEKLLKSNDEAKVRKVAEWAVTTWEARKSVTHFKHVEKAMAHYERQNSNTGPTNKEKVEQLLAADFIHHSAGRIFTPDQLVHCPAIETRPEGFGLKGTSEFFTLPSLTPKKREASA